MVGAAFGDLGDLMDREVFCPHAPREVVPQTEDIRIVYEDFTEFWQHRNIRGAADARTANGLTFGPTRASFPQGIEHGSLDISLKNYFIVFGILLAAYAVVRVAIWWRQLCGVWKLPPPKPRRKDSGEPGTPLDASKLAGRVDELRQHGYANEAKTGDEAFKKPCCWWRKNGGRWRKWRTF